MGEGQRVLSDAAGGAVVISKETCLLHAYASHLLGLTRGSWTIYLA